MPVPQLQQWSKESGKSLKDCEKAWEEAKEQADKKFDKKDSHYWSYVSIVTQKKLGITEAKKKAEQERKKKERKEKKAKKK